MQNLLLGLGALLLTVAGIVFAAVTYDRLGAGGRAAILGVLTTVAGATVPRLKRRGLDATAETVTVLTLALAVLDAYGLRTLGLAERGAPSLYAAGTCAVLALLSGAYAAAVPVRTPRIAGVLLAHLSVPFLLAHAHTTAGSAGLVLAVVAAADLAAWVLTDSDAVRDARATVLVAGSTAAVLAGLTGALGAFADGVTLGAAALLALAVVATAASVVAPAGSVRILLTALPAPLAAAAAYALSDGRLTDVQRPLTLTAIGLLSVQLAEIAPRGWRPGPVIGTLVVTTTALLTQAEATVSAVLLPSTWLTSPWNLSAHAARLALSPETAWDGTVVTLIVLLSAAVATAGAGFALHRRDVAAAPTAALVLASAVVLPLGLASSYPVALALLLVSATALLGLGSTYLRGAVSHAALAAGGILALLATVWSVADQNATLVVLSVVTLLSCGVAVRRGEATAAAGLAGGALLAAAGSAHGLATDEVGALLLVAPAVLVGLGFVLHGLRRTSVELAGAVLATIAMALTHDDAGWLSWALAVVGLLGLADALHGDRRPFAALGGLLLSASSWVRLAHAGITAPEPYVLPLAAVALCLGWLRCRRQPQTRSFAAYGPGLSLLLVPSLVASFDDPTPTRALVVAAGALLVLLVGAQQRLQAPLVIGGGVLAVDALQLLAPYAAALPRWMTLGAGGLLLVTVGATYEQRRRDVAALRERFEALA